MAFILLPIAIYVAAVLQTSLMPAFELRHATPDLFALLAVVWLLLTARPRGFVAAALVGLAYDLTSGGPLGLGLGLFALVGCAVAWLQGRVDAKHLLVQLPLVFFGVTAIALGDAVIWRMLDRTALAGTTLAVRAASVGAYTAAVALPLLMVIGWLGEMRNPWRAAPSAAND